MMKAEGEADKLGWFSFTSRNNTRNVCPIRTEHSLSDHSIKMQKLLKILVY